MMELYSQNQESENNAEDFTGKAVGRLNAGVNTYAYVRVSAKDQNEARQLAAMSALGIPRKRIYVDKQSGKDFERPAYKRLMGKVKTGDLLVIGSIDRLGRNYKEILEQWSMITKEKGVRIRVLDMPILDTGYCSDLTRTLIADIVLQLLSYVAQKERENIRSRQAEGIAAAKARGVRFGRKEAELPDDFEEWYLRWRRKEITGKELSDHLGVHITTVYHRARKLGLSSCSESEKKASGSRSKPESQR